MFQYINVYIQVCIFVFVYAGVCISCIHTNFKPIHFSSDSSLEVIFETVLTFVFFSFHY